ncbi:MAG: hypothetical protein ABW252_02295 [Polyangiales bacterium]
MSTIAACLTPVTTRAQAPAADQAARMEALERELARQAAELAQLRAELARQHEPTVSADEQAAADALAPSAEDAAALAAMLAETQAESEAILSEGPNLRLYGFADVGLQRIWVDDPLSLLAPDTQALTFVLGNLNLYLDANVSPSWRFLAEVRFGLGPNGAVPRPANGFGTGEILDTTYSDPSAPNGAFASVRWAGVIPQRAHIDYTPRDWFNLRAGLFLTPYGIWNVDHGTPTRIMVSEPSFLSQQLMPSQLVGVELFGTVPLLPWTLGYHLHVSNGRTPGEVDLTDNKAVGGRVYLSTRDPYPIKLGLSGYWGTYAREKRSLALREIAVAYTEYALSGDASLDLGALRLRSELVTSWTIYDDGRRPDLFGLTFADNVRVGAYAMGAYQLPWWGLEPLLMIEYLRFPVPRPLPIGRSVIMPSVGLNVYFTAMTMLRSQFALAHGVDLGPNPVDTRGFLYQAATRLITAF